MVITPMWAEQMTAGRGWIALALVVFSGWRAGRLLAGAYFFGILMTLELYAKASGFSFLPSQFWASMPYIMAVAVLAFMSARDVTGSEAPACLGRPFLPKLSAEQFKQGEENEQYYATQSHEIGRRRRPGAARPRARRLCRGPAQDRLHLSRARRRFRLDLGAQQRPQWLWSTP